VKLGDLVLAKALEGARRVGRRRGLHVAESRRGARIDYHESKLFAECGKNRELGDLKSQSKPRHQVRV
jgi:L-amino acid N-acyltransferase YncA